MAGHSSIVTASTLLEALAAERPERVVEVASVTADRPSFEAVYEAHFDFVWRSARRLGVPEAALDDVVQEVFMIVHRQLPGFEGRSSLKTWLFGIARRVVRNHHRGARRKPLELLQGRESLAASGDDPERRYAVLQGQALVHALLEELDADKREVFVLAELEQMPGPEIASALDLNLNTMHARLRAARRDFESALARHAARTRRAP